MRRYDELLPQEIFERVSKPDILQVKPCGRDRQRNAYEDDFVEGFVDDFGVNKKLMKKSRRWQSDDHNESFRRSIR